MTVRDASELLYPAVQETLGSLGEDSAARKLAQQYARVIDSQPGHCRGCDDTECRRSQTSAWAMRWLGPLLLDALRELGATPAARAAMTKGSKDKPGKPKAKSQLEIMRESRARSRA
jgi:hypothetical protein